jgi:hypothetical protein
LLLCVPLAALAYSHVRIVRLTLVQGSVWVTRPGSPEPVRAVEHQPLEHAAVVETVAGVAEIEFEDRTFVRLASGSRLHLAELGLEDNGDRVTHLSLEQGTATFDVRPHRGDSVVLLAPQVTIFFHQKARVRVDLAPSAKRVRVFRGRITLETRADTLSLTAGQMLEWVSDSGSYRIARNPSADAWDEWNDKRAETLAALVHLPVRGGRRGRHPVLQLLGWGGLWELLRQLALRSLLQLMDVVPLPAHRLLHPLWLGLLLRFQPLRVCPQRVLVVPRRLLLRLARLSPASDSNPCSSAA